MIRIHDLVPGDRVRLTNFGETAVLYRRKLLSFGLTIGTELSIIRVAPLGCPVQVALRETHLTLRKDEASQLQWERV